MSKAASDNCISLSCSVGNSLDTKLTENGLSGDVAAGEMSGLSNPLWTAFINSDAKMSLVNSIEPFGSKISHVFKYVFRIKVQRMAHVFIVYDPSQHD